MPSEEQTARELESVDWERVQEIVRAFRRAVEGDGRPALEAFLPEANGNRKAALIELIHEEMEFEIKAGEPFGLAAYLERFPEIADDPSALSELAAAESALRRRMTPDLREGSNHTGKNDPPAHLPFHIGRYELRDVIGQGSFGVVYRAWDTELLRTVALKRPRAGVLEAAGAVDRFLREARSAAGLRHPHIVSVHDVGQVDGEPFLVSSLVEGRNLAEALAAGRFPFRQAAGWIASLAEALEHAHGLGVIHRDVKPSNVLIDGAGRAYLTDFGLAKSDAGLATLTIDGQLLGTPAYMAPEQAGGHPKKIDARADVYALGVILYELLTGTRPFVGAPQMLLVRIQDEDPRPPRRLDDTIPRDLETICLKCLRKAPGERYAGAGELAGDLRRYLAGEPILARPISPRERVARWVRRRPTTAALVALCTASALGLAASWVWQVERERRHARASAIVSLQHAEMLRREAESTRRHLYAVGVGRAYDAWQISDVEKTRQFLIEHLPRPGEDDLRGFEWDYLWKLCDRDLTLRGHQGRIMNLAFSPDGQLLATACDDHTIKLWSVAEWTELATLAGHERAVADLTFSPDGRELYSGSFDGSLRCWDVRTHRAKRILWRDQGAVLSLALAPDGLTLAFFSTSVEPRSNMIGLRFLDLATGSVEACGSPLTASIWSLAYAPDGKTLAEAGGADHQVRIWDTAQRRIRTVLSGHSQANTKLCFSPIDQRLVTSSLDGTLRLWDTCAGRELARQSSLPAYVIPAFSDDGRTLAFTCADEIRLWELATGNIRKIPTPHLGRANALAFSRDEKILAIGGSDGTVRLWETKTGQPLVSRRNRRASAKVAEGPGSTPVSLIQSQDIPYCVAVAPDARFVAVGSDTGFVRVFDAHSGAVQIRLPRRPGPIRGLVFFPDGRTLAASADGESIRLYDSMTGRERLVLAEPDQPERPWWSLALTPGARFMIAGKGVQGEPGRVVIWDLSTGRIQSVLRGHADYVRAVAVAPEGDVLATGSGDETIKIWDLAAGSERASFDGHQGQVFCLAFNPTGELLASGSEDKTIRLWDMARGREVAALRGHEGPVHSVAFTPDGARLASASRDAAIFLWDVATRRKVGNLAGHTMRVNEIKFFPDGHTLVSASIDRSIRFWRSED